LSYGVAAAAVPQSMLELAEKVVIIHDQFIQTLNLLTPSRSDPEEQLVPLELIHGFLQQLRSSPKAAVQEERIQPH